MFKGGVQFMWMSPISLVIQDDGGDNLISTSQTNMDKCNFCILQSTYISSSYILSLFLTDFSCRPAMALYDLQHIKTFSEQSYHTWMWSSSSTDWWNWKNSHIICGANTIEKSLIWSTPIEKIHLFVFQNRAVDQHLYVWNT